MPQVNLRAHTSLLMRSPLLPITLLEQWNEAPDDLEFFNSILSRSDVKESLFIASPSLVNALQENPGTSQRAHRAARLAAIKYVARMAVRCTPFGLCASVIPGQLDKHTDIRLSATLHRRTRVDNDYLFELCDEITRKVRWDLKYFPNTSLAEVGDTPRYAETFVQGRERGYRLVQLEPSDELRLVLQSSVEGASMRQLIQILVEDGAPESEAIEYVESLVDAQVLVSDLGVQITGADPLQTLVASLRQLGDANYAGVLAEVDARLTTLDGSPIGTSVDSYNAIAALLEGFETRVDRRRLFQVDSLRIGAVSVEVRLAKDLAIAVEALARITREAEPPALEIFKREFEARWEGAWIPLALALDEEAGIGFDTSRTPGAEGSPLLDKLALNWGANEQRRYWGKSQRYLLHLLSNALRDKQFAIDLSEADIEELAVETPAVLPDAFSALVRLSHKTPEKTGEVQVLLEGTNGPPATRLLGRFCHLDERIQKMAREQTEREEAIENQGAIFCEIVHLSDGRAANVLCRPVLRDYEIVLLGKSGAARNKQVHLRDLHVTIRNGRVVLYAQRLGREVIPRLSAAHNVFKHSLSAYRFLNAVGAQGQTCVGWDWGPFEDAPFLPRVTLGRVILRRARWNLNKSDLAVLAALGTSGGRARLEEFQTFRRKHGIPKYFVLVEQDNELPVDADNELLVDAFIDEVRGESHVVLTEMFPLPGMSPVAGPEGEYANQVVVSFFRSDNKRDASRRTREAVHTDSDAGIPQTWPPTSEWLYAKIYCGEAVAEEVLRDVIGRFVEENARSFDRWFFIRYSDPDHHLRIRFHGEADVLLENVAPRLVEGLAPLLRSGRVHRLLFDTYMPEVGRYGGRAAITIAEEMFWRDSEAVLAALRLPRVREMGDDAWQLALYTVDTLLEGFGLEREQRLQRYVSGRDAIGSSCGADASVWAQIGNMFRKNAADWQRHWNADPREIPYVFFTERNEHVRRLAAQLRDLGRSGALAASIESIASSVSHMHVNRLLRSSQRVQEMVIYDILRRVLHARAAMKQL